MATLPALRDLLRPATGSPPVFSHRTYERERLSNPLQAAIFESCTFRDVRFEATPAVRASMAGSRFSNCDLDNCYFGPATLDLRNTSFAGSKLLDVTFMLGKLAAADFTGAQLKKVTFRRADLTGASFRQATLRRVSFERATLRNADFTGCRLIQGDFWGEIPWDDAIVEDEIRYSFGRVVAPLRVIETLLASREYTNEQCEHFGRLRDWLLGWASQSPEVTLSYDDLTEVFDKATFVWLLKQLNSGSVETDATDRPTRR